MLFLASRLIARWCDQYDAAVVSAFTKLADAAAAADRSPRRGHHARRRRARLQRAVHAQLLGGRPRLGRGPRRRARPMTRAPAPRSRPECAPTSWSPMRRCAASISSATTSRPMRCARTRSSASASATLTTDRYEIPDDFDPDAWLANSWGIWSSDSTPTERVRLRFDASVAHRVREAIWHRSQTLVELAGRRRRAGRGRGRHGRDPAVDPLLGRGGRGARAAGASRGDRRRRCGMPPRAMPDETVRPAGSGSSPAVRS